MKTFISNIGRYMSGLTAAFALDSGSVSVTLGNYKKYFYVDVFIASVYFCFNTGSFDPCFN